MSIIKNTTFVLFVPLILALIAPIVGSQKSGNNEVLDYYCNRAGAVCRSMSPFETGASFSLTVRTYLTQFKRNGKTELKDSAIVTYYISFDNVDSQQVDLATSNELTKIDFSYPDVFLKEYQFSFYPNDTGGTLLAIGFDSDSTRGLSPVGVAVINRNQFFLKRLYLFYPDVKRYKEYSRYMSFMEYENLIVPDTIRETFAKAGIFSVDYFRRETIIDSIRVYR